MRIMKHTIVLDKFERRNTVAIFFVVGVLPLAALMLSGITGALT